MHVRVRYSDGSLFDGEWQDAPVWGVITIAYIDPVESGPVLRHQGDYYFLSDDGSVVGCDVSTVQCHIERAFGRAFGDTAAVTSWAAHNGFKIGEMIGQHDWKRIYQLGREDTHRLT